MRGPSRQRTAKLIAVASGRAAMPRAEQEFAPTRIQSLARTCRAGHSMPNAKSPDEPGGKSYNNVHGICQRLTALPMPHVLRDHRPKVWDGECGRACSIHYSLRSQRLPALDRGWKSFIADCSVANSRRV